MEKIVTYGDTEMHYYDEGGEGLPAILMHGWGCTAQTMAPIAAMVRQAGYRVINVDFPGFGRSPEPPIVWGVEEYAKMIEHLINEEKLENPLLIGHSFGGRVGIVVASRNPIKKMVLVDAAGVKPKRNLKYYYKIYSFKVAKRVYRLVYGKYGSQQRIDNRRKQSGSSDYAGASPMMRRIMSRVVNEDLCHLMPSIKAETLLIWGENDTATPVSDAQKMDRLIPDTRLVVLENCGHFSYLDNPREFNHQLASFL